MLAAGLAKYNEGQRTNHEREDKSAMITRKVTASESGKRLHRFLRSLLPNMPLGQVYKMIETGKVRVNGKRKKQNYELAAADELTIFMDEEAFRAASPTGGKPTRKFVGVNANITVVHEDDELLVVDKPVGELTHPDRTEQKQTLINRVHAYLHRKGELDSPVFQPATANRLDRNTSGLVLVGKTAGMLHQLNQWMKTRELGKFYVTVAEGTMSGTGTITDALVRDVGANRTRVVRGRGGAQGKGAEQREAVTRYRVLDAADTHSLVEVELVSGRTHQIRAHFQSIGHPLLGDVKYGGKPFERINHQLLHAWRIVLPDGRTFSAPPPPLFQRVLQQTGLELPEHHH